MRSAIQTPIQATREQAQATPPRWLCCTVCGATWLQPAPDGGQPAGVVDCPNACRAANR